MRVPTAVATGVAITLLCSVLQAQPGVRPSKPPITATEPTPRPTPVVVLDVALVFKNHVRFKQRMDELHKERDRFEKDFFESRQAIDSLKSRLKEFKSASPEYKQIEARMARELADLRIKAVAKNSDFLEREGKVYFDTYQEIVAAVGRLAAQHNISLVMRYDSETTDPNDRGSILKAINRDVVYQRNLDITKLVIEQVNAPHVVAAKPGKP